jgi:5-methyltetrahydrofolate--homocysteine methyltransferase
MAEFGGLYEAILNGDQKTAVALTRQALEEGVDPAELIQRYMIPAMDEAGKRFECEEYFVPELLLAARAMKGALELLRPRLAASGAQPAGRVVIGTVKGDLHDIGKNLVASMLEGGGFEVTDLGVDVSPEKFVEAVRSTGAQILCLSALLTVTMPSMRKTIEALSQAGVRDRIKVLVGGAPVTEQYAREIGADGYGGNANVAVAMARQIVAAA